MRNKLLTAFLLGMIFFLLLGYTNNWVESTPTDATVANQIDDFNRKVRIDVAERLETYIGGFNAGDSNAGFYHVLFIENAASLSTPVANKGLLYGLLADSKCELAWMDEDGDEIQLTSGGYWNGAVLLADSVDSNHYAAGSIDLEHMSADSADSNQYVDGSIDAVHIANLDPDSYTTGESVTFANGLVWKRGTSGDLSTNGDTAVSFGTAFSTSCQLVILTPIGTGDASLAIQAIAVKSGTVGTSGFTIYSNYAATGAVTAYWEAWGY